MAMQPSRDRSLGLSLSKMQSELEEIFGALPPRFRFKSADMSHGLDYDPSSVREEAIFVRLSYSTISQSEESDARVA